MIIKNEAFIFDLLNNKLSKSIAFKTMFLKDEWQLQGWFWSNLELLPSKNTSECNQSEQLKLSLSVYRSNWLHKQFIINVSSFFT